MTELGGWWHLARRFFEVATSRTLHEGERAEIDGLLRNDRERSLFWSQPVADQRHALDALRRLASLGVEREVVLRAALLHDIGKQRSGLGIVGRSVASLLAKLGIGTRGRLATYLEHGPRGAEELVAAGAEPLVCEFARYHHGPRPHTIDPDDWALLKRADR